jgi:hypothetical protein
MFHTEVDKLIVWKVYVDIQCFGNISFFKPVLEHWNTAKFRPKSEYITNGGAWISQQCPHFKFDGSDNPTDRP